MKRLLLLILIISCSVITAKAQFGTGGGGSTTVGKISGTLVDSVTKQPLSYASVALFRATGKAPINGVLTDDKGGFKIDGVKPGDYKIRITYVGYPEKFVGGISTTDSKPDKNLGTVLVVSSAKSLKEVQVTGTASLVENKIDKIVYNAEKDLTAAGGNATDVLQKVPLVAVDLNGNVSLRGDNNVRVLINGKPSGATSASLSDVLKTIPADQIKSIEVITSPSAKYDAEGSAGIINIITKQKNMSGVSGSVSGGIGTRQNNGNLNFNYNKNRFSLSINAGGNLTWPQTSLNTFNNDIHPEGTNLHYATSSAGQTYLKRHGGIGNVSVNYDFNAFNSIHSNIRLNQGGFDPNSTNISSFTNFNHPDSNSTYTSRGTSHNTFGGFDWNLDYTHKFKKEGHELDISTQWSHSKIVTDYMTRYTAQYPNQKNNIDGLNNEYTAQVDYTNPLTKKLKLEAGGKEIIRRINSNSDLFMPDPQNSDGFIPDALGSSTYDYNQNVTAGYSVFTITLPKGYSILAGVRDEYTTIHAVPQSLGQNLQPFDLNYNTFVPSLTLQKQISTTQTVKLAYSKRITRPSLQFLNPYVNTNNNQAATEGNPTLSPEISQTYELDYITFIGGSVLNFSAYYRHTANVIENIAVGTAANQGTLSTYQNAAENNSFGGSFFGSVSPWKPLTLRASINVYTYNPTAYAQYQQYFSQTGVYWQYSGFASAELDLKNGFIAQVFTFGSSPRRTIQGSSPSFSLLGAGIRKQFLNKKASIGINTLEPFNKYKNFNTSTQSAGLSQTSTFAFPFRSVGLTLSYSFGKVTFSNQQKKGVNNDDMKQGDQGVGGAGGAPGSR
ncbi:outer membrane beta-barrel family protein [Mucilaginibacter ginsenosidivorans]|uniref:TonB-dependent receptor n=1 Tax=Mucilaginibacter ginsenosidivorans TaxID=398053 RepID=A0A5B8V2A5_9SPHI|nr:outer membrane beta-barrel family protein [Mucilaginibacter ginsenosidivorans]QEC65318.1 TonB-dependent receptor [Mucilaginibacter ginsenosidivorans]